MLYVALLSMHAIILRMYIATVPNRRSPPAILLRESYREGGKVRTLTLANLTGWEPQRIEALRRALKGDFECPNRSAPNGYPVSSLFDRSASGEENGSRSGNARQGHVLIVGCGLGIQGRRVLLHVKHHGRRLS
jgi:hypothetical protein